MELLKAAKANAAQLQFQAKVLTSQCTSPTSARLLYLEDLEAWAADLT